MTHNTFHFEGALLFQTKNNRMIKQEEKIVSERKTGMEQVQKYQSARERYTDILKYVRGRDMIARAAAITSNATEANALTRDKTKNGI